MRYELKSGSFPVVECQLENGEQMITERGSMVWMSPNMQMETSGGGLGRMFSKAFSGESIFQNIYITGPGKVWLQTMPISNVAMAIRPYIPTGNG